MSDPVAAIDVGTNTVLQLVARRAPGGALEVLDDRSSTARLGEGLARTGRLDDAAVERTLGVLAGYLALARERGVAPDRVRAAGTAVLRRAGDAGRFVDLCRERLDLDVEVLSEDEEARLGHRAVTGAAGAGAETVVVDVGGGSSEVVTDGGRSLCSVPVGAVVLTERYLGLADRPPAQDGGWPALLEEVRSACARLPAGGARGRDTVLIGGTAVNLACLVLGLERFDHERAEGARVPPGAAAEQAQRIAGLPRGERLRLPIEADRAEILPAGLACIAGCLGRLEAGVARVSGRGLRYGLALELLARDRS